MEARNHPRFFFVIILQIYGVVENFTSIGENHRERAWHKNKSTEEGSYFDPFLIFLVEKRENRKKTGNWLKLA